MEGKMAVVGGRENLTADKLFDLLGSDGYPSLWNVE
jgi:hypothetical protein